MAIERGEQSAGRAPARSSKPGSGLLGSLKDALRAAGREDAEGMAAAVVIPPARSVTLIAPAPAPAAVIENESDNGGAKAEGQPDAPLKGSMSAAEAARHARTISAPPVYAEPPTTRVLRPERKQQSAPAEPEEPRTQLVRGRQTIARDTFVQDPVVGFLIVVGGPGLGAARAIYEGNNTVGRARSNRIALDFGDETISAEEQAYIRYDSADRSFLFVPNLAKTNVVSVNEKRPTSAIELKPMDIVTFGRTQVAFLPFCGPEFDWSEISDAKD
ncbi:MAG TPA: FHA domain-containing protein [Hyphomicrobium sp.]|nr:FHA domain-containing protein [Hyphomicrobium sp.]